MDKRIELRPKVDAAVILEDTSKEEQFQNQTIRPIIKLQHPILLLFVKETIHNMNPLYASLSKGKRESFVKSLFSKDVAFKSKVVGLVVGQFTIEEMEMYMTNVNSINKRILNICVERMHTHLNELTKE